jgi:co-chaperonin GroES (HSP10)
MKIQPVGNRILVSPEPGDCKGVRFGQIMELGYDVPINRLSKGMWILFGKSVGHDVTIEGARYTVVSYGDVIAVVDPGAKKS